MRSFRHWTPRYVVDRLGEIWYQRRHPDHPWLTKTAISMLQSYLRDSDRGLEFGSGRSTLWFAKRVGELTSVEHDEKWHKKVSGMLAREGITNTRHLLREIGRGSEDLGMDTAYVRVADEFENDALDFVLVDGHHRSACVCSVLNKIRPGGILIIDNVNWYLPNASHSPASLRPREDVPDPLWEQFLLLTADWRRIWTSSGVTDTAFFFKPCKNQMPVQLNA